MVVPFVVALSASLELHHHRTLELLLVVVLLFAQLYAPRFGVWAGDLGAGLFTAYLCGLLLPLPPAAPQEDDRLDLLTRLDASAAALAEQHGVRVLGAPGDRPDPASQTRTALAVRRRFAEDSEHTRRTAGTPL